MASGGPAPSAAVDALLLLANGFVARGQPWQAIKCYTAVCQSKHELPAIGASANVQLGLLLLEHSHNVLAAQQALNKAVRESGGPLKLAWHQSAFEAQLCNTGCIMHSAKILPMRLYL